MRTRTHVFGAVAGIAIAAVVVVICFGTSVVVVEVVLEVVLVVVDVEVEVLEVLVDIEVVGSIDVVVGSDVVSTVGSVVGGIVGSTTDSGNVVVVAHISRAMFSSHFSTSMWPSTSGGDNGLLTKSGLTIALKEYGQSGVESPTGISKKA